MCVGLYLLQICVVWVLGVVVVLCCFSGFAVTVCLCDCFAFGGVFCTTFGVLAFLLWVCVLQ